MIKKKKKNVGTSISSIALSAVCLLILFSFIYSDGFSFVVSTSNETNWLKMDTFHIRGFGSQPWNEEGTSPYALGLGWDILSGYPIKGLIITSIIFLFISLAISITAVACEKQRKWLQVTLAPLGGLTAILIFASYASFSTFVNEFISKAYNKEDVIDKYIPDSSLSIFVPVFISIAIFGVNLGGAISIAKFEKAPLEKQEIEDDEIPVIKLEPVPAASPEKDIAEEIEIKTDPIEETSDSDE